MSDRPHPVWRRSTLVGVGTVLALVPITCPYPGLGAPMTLAWYESSKIMVLRTMVLFGSGTLTTPNSTSKAITYDPDLAPVGAAMTATIIPTSEGSTAEFTVFGLVPNRGYAVSAHTKACGASANAAGARWRYRLDPAATPHTTSNEAKQGNPNYEISLVVRTDATGAGTSRTNLPFTLTERGPGSMVMYDETQRSARIACLTLSVR